MKSLDKARYEVQPAQFCQGPSHPPKCHSTYCYTRKATIAAQPGWIDKNMDMLSYKFTGA